MLYLADSIKDEPFLISHLFRDSEVRTRAILESAVDGQGRGQVPADLRNKLDRLKSKLGIFTT